MHPKTGTPQANRGKCIIIIYNVRDYWNAGMDFSNNHVMYCVCKNRDMFLDIFVISNRV